MVHELDSNGCRLHRTLNTDFSPPEKQKLSPGCSFLSGGGKSAFKLSSMQTTVHVALVPIWIRRLALGRASTIQTSPPEVFSLSVWLGNSRQNAERCRYAGGGDVLVYSYRRTASGSVRLIMRGRSSQHLMLNANLSSGQCTANATISTGLRLHMKKACRSTCTHDGLIIYTTTWQMIRTVGITARSLKSPGPNVNASISSWRCAVLSEKLYVTESTTQPANLKKTGTTSVPVLQTTILQVLFCSVMS